MAVEKLPFALVMRMPSMIQIGSLFKLIEFIPRTRIRAPVPVCVPLVTETPAARELSRSFTLAIGADSTTLATEMFAVALPISTRRCSPVAVVTTGVRFTATVARLKLAVVGCPSVTVTLCLVSA